MAKRRSPKSSAGRPSRSSRARYTSGGRAVPDRELIERAVNFGREQAGVILAKRSAKRAAARAGSAGIIVAEGDSWFDYPFNHVLEKLRDDHGFRTESVAHRGDAIEEMAYDPAQGAALANVLTQLADDGETPRAILLSGGGNDMVGDQFAMMINHVSSGLPALNASVVNGVINERLMYAYGCVIGRTNQMTEALFPNPVPIVIHGYAYAVPDGRGFLGGGWILPGPWLRPGFLQKGHTDLAKNKLEIENLINTLNGMLALLPTFPNIKNTTYLDLRSVLTNGPTYKQDWENELHPTPKGFGRVADEFAARINLFPMP
jgi:hypothetical protein